MNRSRLARQMPTQTIASTIDGDALPRRALGALGSPDGFYRLEMFDAIDLVHGLRLSITRTSVARRTRLHGDEQIQVGYRDSESRSRRPATDRGRSSSARHAVRQRRACQSHFRNCACASLQSGRACANAHRPALVSLMRRLRRSASDPAPARSAFALQRPQVLTDGRLVHAPALPTVRGWSAARRATTVRSSAQHGELRRLAVRSAPARNRRICDIRRVRLAQRRAIAAVELDGEEPTGLVFGGPIIRDESLMHRHSGISR